MQRSDVAAVLALNADVVELTSPMDEARFDALFEAASLRLVAEHDGEVLGFLLALADDRSYENANFAWFSARLRSFLYVDRVVVSARSRGLGIGQLLYGALFDSAARSGLLNVCAEIDLDPPNEGSLRFHERSGFVRIGTRTMDGGKVLSMQLAPVIDTRDMA